MEACSLSSNSFTKTIQVLPLAGGRCPAYTTKFSGCGRARRFGAPLSIACSQSGGSSSASPRYEASRALGSDWREFRAKLVFSQQAWPGNDTAPTSAADQDTAVEPLQPIALGENWAHKIHEPEKGCLLIATEKLDGVHIFERTVILVLSTGPVGPTGLILNRPSLMSIKEMRSSTLGVSGKFSDQPLFFGGPLEEGLFLVNPKRGNDEVEKIGAFEELMKGLYYGKKESLWVAGEMVKRDLIGVGDLRFFDGFCAWEGEQLREEIRAGYWTLAACSASVVGLTGVGSIGLWEEILGLVGPSKVC